MVLDKGVLVSSTRSPSTATRARSSQSAAGARLAKLRTHAATAPHRAQNEAWAWLQQLGRDDEQATLAELFAHGIAASPGTRTAGMPVGSMRDMPGTTVVNAILALDSPWTGKTFHNDASGGYNRVKLYAAPMVALLRHRARLEGRELVGFPFNTSIQPGVVEPQVDVLAIEYHAPEHRNPSRVFPLTHVRDELVEILPNTYLGRATWQRTPGDYVLVGYFALRRPTTSER
jgi:hypothetical protein